MSSNDWVAVGKRSTFQPEVPRELMIYPETGDELSAWEQFDFREDDSVEPVGVYQISTRTFAYMELSEEPEMIAAGVERFFRSRGMPLSAVPLVLEARSFIPEYTSVACPFDMACL